MIEVDAKLLTAASSYPMLAAANSFPSNSIIFNALVGEPLRGHSRAQGFTTVATVCTVGAHPGSRPTTSHEGLWSQGNTVTIREAGGGDPTGWRDQLPSTVRRWCNTRPRARARSRVTAAVLAMVLAGRRAGPVAGSVYRIL